ncbi:mitochondrial ornithine transporter 1 [Hydra vulgaris]|uniref:Mitochondrial ornithine transporter 1 n=1 Tax=Hydra vulgaris TaxID=6087 RepID=T2M219_HYDVU|nr:mitochondrial ornithine transporter 1 [Hydra vulgaris]
MEISGLSKEVSIDFVAGAVGGVCCAYVGQPLDTIKVKMQTFPDIYKSSIRCASETFYKHGLRQFYAGSVPAAAANIAENSVLFLCYGQCSKIVAYMSGTNKDNMSLIQKALSGSFASFFAAFALCPLELIKCRMQTVNELGSNKKITPFKIVREVLIRDGPLGFYHGITSTILREVPGYFFFFGGYEGTKVLLANNEEEFENPGVLKTIIAGGNGGLALWSAVYPFDIIKSRMQVYSAGGKSVGMIHTVNIIYNEGGLRSFYRGIAPTLVRAFPACAALFVGYEYTKKLLNHIF